MKRPLVLFLVGTTLVGCEQRTSSPRSDSAAPRAVPTARPAAITPESTPKIVIPEAPSGVRPQDAALVVRIYLTALRAGAYGRAASLWAEGSSDVAGDSAALRRSLGDTTIVSFEVGKPGEVEGAAGSRGVDVPAVIEISVGGGAPVRQHVVFTLRRAAMEGASAADRRWHITLLNST